MNYRLCPCGTWRYYMTRELTITNALGLNASNAPKIVQVANSFKCSIWLETEDRKANAKSLLGVISLGAKKDMSIVLSAEGSDAEEAVEKLSALIENGFSK